jgi:hypothetical protein
MELPEQLVQVVDLLIQKQIIAETERFDSCTINLYRQGQWVPPHIDNPAFARPFVTVSLLSDQLMILGRGIVWPPNELPEAIDGYEGEELRLMLPVCSAVRVEKEAANIHEHAIPPVTEDRISLTFRRRLDPSNEQETFAQQVMLTEKCRNVYRKKRKAIRQEQKAHLLVENKVPSRRELIAKQRAAIKAARKERNAQKSAKAKHEL